MKRKLIVVGIMVVAIFCVAHAAGNGKYSYAAKAMFGEPKTEGLVIDEFCSVWRGDTCIEKSALRLMADQIGEDSLPTISYVDREKLVLLFGNQEVPFALSFIQQEFTDSCEYIKYLGHSDYGDLTVEMRIVNYLAFEQGQGQIIPTSDGIEIDF